MYHVGRDALIPPLELVQTLRRLEGKPPYARYLQILICLSDYITPLPHNSISEAKNAITKNALQL